MRNLTEFLADVLTYGTFSFLVALSSILMILEKPPDPAQAFPVRAVKEMSARDLPVPYSDCAKLPGCAKMAEALVYEARSEGRLGMRAVAYVILERKTSKGWRDTIRGVIEQPWQFSYLGDMHKQKAPSKEDFDIAYEEAYSAIFGLSENPVPGAKWYHTKTAKWKSWMGKLKPTYYIGNHIFYTEGK